MNSIIRIVFRLTFLLFFVPAALIGGLVGFVNRKILLPLLEEFIRSTQSIITPMPEFVRQLFPNLPDSYGLYHHPRHLNSIHRKIVFFDINKQASYSSLILRNMLDQYLRNLENQSKGTMPPPFLSNLNQIDFRNPSPTTVGDIAYIALHHPDKEFAEAARQWLAEAKSYLEQFKKP